MKAAGQCQTALTNEKFCEFGPIIFVITVPDYHKTAQEVNKILSAKSSRVKASFTIALIGSRKLPIRDIQLIEKKAQQASWGGSH